MKILIILAIIFINLYDFILSLLTVATKNKPLPAIVSDIFDQEEYKKRNSYELATVKISLYSLIVNLVLSITYLTFNFHSAIYNWAGVVCDNVFIKSAIMIVALGFVNYLASLPFNLYQTFKIEAEYGFNKTTPKIFIADTIKKYLLIFILGGGLLYAFIELYDLADKQVFIYFYFILVAILLIVTLLLRVFMRGFNKFTLLDEGPLYDKITAYAQKVNYPVKKIYIMNASLRSTKANAFFSGFGKAKSIVLYDTLLNKCSDEEIVAILAHEVGHAKGKHVLYNFIFSLITLSIILLGAYFIVPNSEISKAFGFNELNLTFGILIFFILYAPISLILNIPSCIISRAFEYQADNYAAKTTTKADIANSLKTLAKANYVNLVPNRFVVVTTYSHPPIKDRLEAILK